MGESAQGVRLPRPEHVEPVALSALTEYVNSVATSAHRAELRGIDLNVTGITATSAMARPGDLFAAIPGQQTHGATYVPDALARGAVAVLTDDAGAAMVTGDVPVVLVDGVRAVLSHVASAVYGHPSASMRLFGVTGTSGKTTTTFFLRAALEAAGCRSGLMGTVATYIGEQEIKTGFTTPEAPDVQALLAVMRERGVTDVAMEVSSHALELGRVHGWMFDVAGFTNLSQDHLDFHPDMNAYFGAKKKLFEAGSAWPVIVVDDEWGRLMSELVAPCTTVSIDGNPSAGWSATEIDERPDGTIGFLVSGDEEVPVAERGATAIPGRFNVANAVLAIAMLHHEGFDPHEAAAAIAAATVPGRMERVDAGQAFLALVDYSHKPAAVEGALSALRALTSGRLVVVLGCGGDRDHAKRPVMGAIAARDADVFIATDDNPRSEDPAAIRREMLAGVATVPEALRAEVHEIGDRGEAIAAAVALARPGDTVLVAGKGHESGQEIAGVVHSFDDRVVLRAALEKSLA